MLEKKPVISCLHVFARVEITFGIRRSEKSEMWEVGRLGQALDKTGLITESHDGLRTRGKSTNV